MRQTHAWPAPRACGRPAGRPPRPDLAVLTPPLLVCAAFLVAVAAFVRHEMGASRKRRDQDAPGEIPGGRTIPDSESTEAPAQSHDVDATGAD